MARDLEVDELEMALILDAIHARYGYDLRGYAPDSLRRRLRDALVRSGLSHFGELQHRLIHDPSFFTALLDHLTVQVTEMFRDPAFYRAFRERVTPILRTYPELRIWHAGCASGAEVYATAIVLLEEDLYDRAQIYATDLSASALERAREGIFPDKVAGDFESNYFASGGKRKLDEYYSRAYGSVAMRESLRRHVVFFQHNLVSDFALGEMHAIFCRNVLIYFGGELRQRVVSMFAEGLCRGGFLCLGASESLPESASGLFSEFCPRERIYRHKGAA